MNATLLEFARSFQHALDMEETNQILKHAQNCFQAAERMDPETDDPQLVEAALKKAHDAIVLLTASTSTRKDGGPLIQTPEAQELHQNFIALERDFNAAIADRVKAKH